MLQCFHHVPHARGLEDLTVGMCVCTRDQIVVISTPVSIEYDYQVEMNFMAEWKLELTQHTESVWNLSLPAIVPLYPEWQTAHVCALHYCVCMVWYWITHSECMLTLGQVDTWASPVWITDLDVVKVLFHSENDTAYMGITTDRNVNGGNLCSANTPGYVIIKTKYNIILFCHCAVSCYVAKRPIYSIMTLTIVCFDIYTLGKVLHFVHTGHMNTLTREIINKPISHAYTSCVLSIMSRIMIWRAVCRVVCCLTLP